MLIGIEIEGYINKNVDIKIAEYHSSKFNNYKFIKFERDETLTSKIGTAIEIVSNILKDENDLNLMFEEIKNALKIQNEEESVILVDSTCGCHIHFSHETKKDYILLDKLYRIKRMHEAFLKHYDYKQYECFKKQYNRAYAAEIFDIADNDRCSEVIDTGRKGLEWRSFNLLGVRNFADIRARLTNIFKLIQKYYTYKEVKYPNKLFNHHCEQVVKVYDAQICDETILTQQQVINAHFSVALEMYENEDNIQEIEITLSEEKENFLEEEIFVNINQKQKESLICVLSL